MSQWDYRWLYNKFHGKGIKLKTFAQGYVISLCGVVLRLDATTPSQPDSSPIQYLIFFVFFLFSPFFEFLFSINILNNCYLIKCNKQLQEKYCVSREKIVHSI